MEHRDKFQKKFSDFRTAVASKSPVARSRSNSVIKRNNPKVLKPKDKQIENQKPKMEKKNLNSKLTTLNNSSETLHSFISPTLIRDLELQLSTLNSTLKHLPINSVKQITNYYQIVKEFVKEMIDSPLNNILRLLHSVYTLPLPTLITKNDFSTKIYTEQSEKQSHASDLINKSKMSLSNYKNNSVKSSNIPNTANTSMLQLEPMLSKDPSCKKVGFKLNMDRIQETKGNVKDYFDEFYDNINEFSESWRQQALKEKR